MSGGVRRGVGLGVGRRFPQVGPKLVPGDAGDPLDGENTFGWDRLPHGDSPPGEANVGGYLGDHPALGADQFHSRHADMLSATMRIGAIAKC